MIKNIKVHDKFLEYLNNTKTKSKLVLATLSLAIGLSMTGCSTNKYSELDINKIDSKTTTVDDSEDYYEKNVESVKRNMTEAELENYYINVDVDFIK